MKHEQIPRELISRLAYYYNVLTPDRLDDRVDAADFAQTLAQAITVLNDLAGNGRPVHDAMEVHRRIAAAIRKAGSCSAWARQLDVSKSYAHEVYSGLRPASDTILASLGLQRKRGRELFLEL